MFRAKDTKTGQDVALKVLPTDFPADDAEVQRFVRVMKQFLPLHHAGLAQLRGVGKTGPYVWVASELVAGDSLAVADRAPGRSKRANGGTPCGSPGTWLERWIFFIAGT